jgi:AraC-like DNA-binding protein
LHASGGLVPVKEIAAEVGWSRKHLLLQFRDHVGLPPKTLARIIRFNRTLRCLEGIEAPHWAEIAHACGYYDQAHFNRDFRAFAGTTPGDYLRRRIAEGGVVGD